MTPMRTSMTCMGSPSTQQSCIQLDGMALGSLSGLNVQEWVKWAKVKKVKRAAKNKQRYEKQAAERKLQRAAAEAAAATGRPWQHTDGLASMFRQRMAFRGRKAALLHSSAACMTRLRPRSSILGITTGAVTATVNELLSC